MTKVSLQGNKHKIKGWDILLYNIIRIQYSVYSIIVSTKS